MSVTYVATKNAGLAGRGSNMATVFPLVEGEKIPSELEKCVESLKEGLASGLIRKVVDSEIAGLETKIEKEAEVIKEQVTEVIGEVVAEAKTIGEKIAAKLGFGHSDAPAAPEVAQATEAAPQA